MPDRVPGRSVIVPERFAKEGRCIHALPGHGHSVRLRCLRSSEFFSEIVSNGIAIGQVKEIGWHGLGQPRAAMRGFLFNPINGTGENCGLLIRVESIWWALANGGACPSPAPRQPALARFWGIARAPVGGGAAAIALCRRGAFPRTGAWDRMSAFPSGKTVKLKGSPSAAQTSRLGGAFCLAGQRARRPESAAR
jgi:hypothetical protein